MPDLKNATEKLPNTGALSFGNELTDIYITAMNDKSSAALKAKIASSLDADIDAARNKVDETYSAQLKTEQDCPQGTPKEEYFKQQKAIVAEYAANVMAVNMTGKLMKNLRYSYKDMEASEIKQTNKQTLSQENLTGTANAIKQRDDWQHMVDGIKSWNDLNKFKNLTAQNKGAALMNDLAEATKY